ncbi:hypothetical protein CC86DRAFT_455014 [Ophiobolus disseminans]|uniref:Ricin B lectin domain-containing protein n=1 Tax=Ophiobolus disseminans TaxID=1469910 RepID=A0A6A7A430_9PLEO|nr:hypothetical protein CC86DRAFT_455014 [Ophiobolus disseminans]
MTEFQAGKRYILTNSLIGSTNALATTSANDTVIVIPSKTDISQKWYFVETSKSGYYRLHTEQKGDFAALDVVRWTDALELHMYSVQDNTGQLWRLNKQDDGSYKINNQFTGSDLYLDIVKDTLQPTLAARDGPGQRWALSQVGSIPTATLSPSRLPTGSMTTITTTPTMSTVSGSNSATPSAAGSSSGLSKAAIGGIAAGGGALVLALIAGGLILLKRHNDKKRNNGVAQNPPAMTSRPLLRVS